MKENTSAGSYISTFFGRSYVYTAAQRIELAFAGMFTAALLIHDALVMTAARPLAEQTWSNTSPLLWLALAILMAIVIIHGSLAPLVVFYAGLFLVSCSYFAWTDFVGKAAYLSYLTAFADDKPYLGRPEAIPAFIMIAVRTGYLAGKIARLRRAAIKEKEHAHG